MRDDQPTGPAGSPPQPDQPAAIPPDRPTQPARQPRPVLAWISLAAASLLVALLAFSARSQQLALHPIVRLPDPSRPPSPEIASLTLSTLAMSAPDDGWAFATYYIPPRANADGNPLGPPQTRTAMLRYDGTSWRVGDTLSPYYINSISMVSRDDGWAAGYGGLLHYTGARWSPVTLPVPPATPAPDGPQYAFSFQTIEMVSAEEGWAAGNGVFYHYHGGTWAPVSIPVTAAQYSIFDLSMRGRRKAGPSASSSMPKTTAPSSRCTTAEGGGRRSTRAGVER